MTANNNYTCNHGHGACSQVECSRMCPSHPDIWNMIRSIRSEVET